MAQVRGGEREHYKKTATTSAEGIFGKRLPSNIDAEKAVLSAILLNADNMSLVMDMLSADDFYSHQHQIVYS